MTAKRRSAAKKKATARKSRSPLGVWISINQAAEEFSCDRGALTRQITDARLIPDEAGRFRLRDVIRVRLAGADGKVDPDKMTPFERQAHFKAESERMRLNIERGLLLRVADVETEWARVLKMIAHELDLIVDEIERDVGASTAVLEKIEVKLDVIRQRMYSRVVDEDDVGAIRSAA